MQPSHVHHSTLTYAHNKQLAQGDGPVDWLGSIIQRSLKRILSNNSKAMRSFLNKTYLLCLLLSITSRTHGQDTPSIAQQDTALLAFGREVTTIPIIKWKNRKDTTGIVSWWVYERMGNRFVASYLFGSSDATPTKSYAALDNDDGSLGFGYNIPFHKGFEQWKGILTLGAKADITKSYAPISTVGKGFRDNLGAVVKFSFIGNPALGFLPNQPAPALKYMTYKKTVLEHEAKRWVREEGGQHDASTEAYRAKEAEGKTRELREKLIMAIVDHVEDEKLYTSLWNWWITADIYIPLTRKPLLVADSASQVSPVSTSAYPTKVEGRFFIARKSPNGNSFLFTVGVSATNNNSAWAQKLKTTSFQSLFTRSAADTIYTAVINSRDVYLVKDYKTFISPALESGIVVGLCPCHPNVRFRISLQQYFKIWENEYTPTIWTLGVPLTLIDKNKKPTVNIEPQLLITNGASTFGVSVGVPLGDWLSY